MNALFGEIFPFGGAPSPFSKGGLRAIFWISFFAYNLCGNTMHSMLLPSEEPSVITFKEALNRALLKNLSLKQAEQDVVIAESESQLAISKILPTLALQASHEVLNRTSAEDKNVKAGLNLTVSLLDAKSLVEAKAKRESLASAREKYRYEQDSLINEVGALYIDALTARALKENAYEEQELYRRQFSLLERKVAIGSARSLDVTRAQYLAHKSHSDYLLKNHEFLEKMGELGDKIGTKDFFLLSTVKIISPHFLDDEKSLLAIATKTPDIISAQKDVRAAEFSLLSEKVNFLPKLNATFDSGWHMPYEKAFSMKMMLNLELPLFSGGSSFAALKNKNANKTIQELILRSKTDEIVLNISGLLQQIKDLQVVISSAQLALDAASKAKQSAERLFEKGEATGLELVEANSNHFNAKNQEINAHLKLEHIKLRLLFAIGKVKELL